jgi:prophage regulatory protein
VKLLRPKACATALGVSTVTLWRWAKAGDFPQPYRIGKQAIAWDEASLLEWLQTRRVACPDTQAPASDRGPNRGRR